LLNGCIVLDESRGCTVEGYGLLEKTQTDGVFWSCEEATTQDEQK
jgi:hypothetical protein